MKNIVRAFVLSLVVTGAYASTHLNSSATSIHAKVSAMPVPCCPPGDPQGCGICQIAGCGR